MFDQIIRFFQESYHELRLSSWLSTQEMASSTLIVLVLTIVVALYISCIDQVLLYIARILFRIG
jgi:preprotein translocase SecE subunit